MKVILNVTDINGNSPKEIVYENVYDISNEGEWWELEVYEQCNDICISTDEKIRNVIQIPITRIISIAVSDIQETVFNTQKRQ